MHSPSQPTVIYPTKSTLQVEFTYNLIKSIQIIYTCNTPSTRHTLTSPHPLLVASRFQTGLQILYYFNHSNYVIEKLVPIHCFDLYLRSTSNAVFCVCFFASKTKGVPTRDHRDRLFDELIAEVAF